MKAPEKKTASKKAVAKKMPEQAVTAKPADAGKRAKKAVPKKQVAKKQAAKKQAPEKAQAQAAPVAPVESGAAVLDRLFAVITERRTADPSRSHSARLLSRGMPKVAQKFGEEAVECLIEAVAGNAEAMVGESADVLYHLLVMWVAAGVAPDQVWAELTRREGVSGIAEKLSRTGPLGTTKIP